MSTDVTAGNRGLTELYRVVKQVAPKKGRRELQLRGAHGMPLMASQEFESGAKFYEELYLMPRAANKAQWPGAEMPQFSPVEVKSALALRGPSSAVNKLESYSWGKNGAPRICTSC